MILFDNAISITKVRKGIYAYKYSNGLVLIEEQRYYGYSIKLAIKLWRSRN
jgi:hypothetical protein